MKANTVSFLPGPRLRENIRAIRGKIILNILVDAIANVAYAVIPGLTAVLVDQVLIHHQRSLWSVGLMYAGVLFTGLFCEILGALIWWKVGVRFERSVKQTYFEAFLARPVSWPEPTSTGSELSEVTNNVNKIEMDYLTPVVAIIKDGIALVAYGIALALFSNIYVAAIVFGLSVAALGIPRIMSRRLSSATAHHLKVLGVYTDHLHGFLEGRPEIPEKAHAALGKAHWRSATRAMEARYGYGKAKTIANGLTGTGAELIVLAAFIISGAFCINGLISVGAVAATIGYSKDFLSPLKDIFYSINAINSTDDIRTRFEQASTGPDDPTDTTTGVIVRPADAPRLDGVERIHLSDGDRVFLQGASGVGKTTLLKHIYFAGEVGTHPVSTSLGTSPDPRDSVFYVGATSPVFHASFHDNATLFGAFQWDADKVSRLSADTGLLERLQNRDDMTVCSSGERQFMLVCRALLSGSTVYLLDEAFSALDQSSATAIMNSFIEMTAGSTIFFVSHHGEPPQTTTWKRVSLRREGLHTVVC